LAESNGNDAGNDVSPLREAFGLYNGFGIAIGALSVFLLLQKVVNFETNTVLVDLLSAYRWFFHDVLLGSVWRLLSFKPPAWVNDLIVFWCAMSSIALRTLSRARRWSRIHAETVTLGTVEQVIFLRFPAWLFPLFAALASFVFWPLLFARFAYSVPIDFMGRSGFFASRRRTINVGAEYPGHLVRYSYRRIWIRQLLAISLLIVLLVVTNAGLPTPN
jgi:hypothetical protein